MEPGSEISGYSAGIGMEPGLGIGGYSAGIGMEPGLGIGGYSAGVDLTAQKLNNISDSLKREFKNTRQNAAMGIQKKKGGGYTKFKKFSSNTGKAIGKVVKNQLVESGANIACDVLMGNDIKESMQREVQNARQNAAIGIQQIKRKNINKPVQQPPSKKKKKIKQSKFNGLSLQK